MDVLGDYYVGQERADGSLRRHNNHPDARKCSKQRGGRGGKRTRGSPPTMLYAHSKTLVWQFEVFNSTSDE